MAYSFSDSWAQEVADVSELPEFQNAVITLRKGSAKYAEDIPARIIGIRSTLDVNGQTTGSATGSQAIRIQFPYSAYPARVARGTQVQVVDGGRNPALEGYLIIVDSDNMSSQRASHTLSCSTNVESVAVWT